MCISNKHTPICLCLNIKPNVDIIISIIIAKIIMTMTIILLGLLVITNIYGGLLIVKCCSCWIHTYLLLLVTIILGAIETKPYNCNKQDIRWIIRACTNIITDTRVLNEIVISVQYMKYKIINYWHNNSQQETNECIKCIIYYLTCYYILLYTPYMDGKIEISKPYYNNSTFYYGWWIFCPVQPIDIIVEVWLIPLLPNVMILITYHWIYK